MKASNLTEIVYQAIARSDGILRKEIIEQIGRSNPEYEVSKIKATLSSLFTKKRRIRSDGKIPATYTAVVKIPEFHGEVVRPYQPGIMPAMTTESYDIHALENLAMLTRK